MHSSECCHYVFGMEDPCDITFQMALLCELYPSPSPKSNLLPVVAQDTFISLILVTSKRGSAEAESLTSTPRSSIVTQIEGSPPSAKAGAVVTSSRRSKRR